MERRNKNVKQKGNGEGTIYYSQTLNKWVAQYIEPSGKRRTIKQRRNEKVSDFKKRFYNAQSRINQGFYIEKNTETFIEILNRHVEQKHDDGTTGDSAYLRDLKTVKLIKNTCENFMNKPIQKITAEDIEYAKKYMRVYAQSSIDKAWRLINKVFKICIGRRRIIFNPLDDETLTKPISIKDKKEVRALSIKEQIRLEDVLDHKVRKHKYRNIAKLQLNTGMRIGEVLARIKSDVNLKNNKLKVDTTLTVDEKGNIILGKHTKTYDRKTGIDHGKRFLFMSADTREIIIEEINKKITNIYGLLFWDYKNNTFISYNEINAWLGRINQKYKITDIDLTTHVLRHTRITRMREANVDMKVIQDQVGHVEGSKETDETYTTLFDEFIKNELKKIN